MIPVHKGQRIHRPMGHSRRLVNLQRKTHEPTLECPWYGAVHIPPFKWRQRTENNTICSLPNSSSQNHKSEIAQHRAWVDSRAFPLTRVTLPTMTQGHQIAALRNK